VGCGGAAELRFPESPANSAFILLVNEVLDDAGAGDVVGAGVVDAVDAGAGGGVRRKFEPAGQAFYATGKHNLQPPKLRRLMNGEGKRVSPI